MCCILKDVPVHKCIKTVPHHYIYTYRLVSGGVRRTVRGGSIPDMKFTVQRYDAVPNGPPATEKQCELELSSARSSGTHSPDDNETVVSSPDETDSRVCESPLPEKSDDHGSSPEPNEYTLGYSTATMDIADPMARRGRLYAKRQTRRLVFKDGDCNISQ